MRSFNNYYYRRPRKKIRLRKGRLLFVGLLLVLVVAVVSAVRFINSFQKMQNQEAWAQSLREAPTEQGTNHLLYGVAQREGAYYADQIILYNILEGRDSPNIIFLPGETVVDLPSYGPATLGEAYANGGSKLLVETLMNFLNVPIHHYVEMNYELIPLLVEEMGWIELQGQLLEAPDFYDYFLQANGESGTDCVENLARRREALGILLKSLCERYTTRHVPGLVRKCSPYVETDFSWKELANFYNETMPLYEKNTLVVSLPGTWETSYFFPDEEAVALMMSKIGEEVLFPRELISVEVLNGSGEAGIAALVGDWLAEQGFLVKNIDNADHFDYARTRVIGRLEDVECAREVATFIPGAELHKEPLEGYDYMVSVIIGHNFDPEKLSASEQEEAEENQAD